MKFSVKPVVVAGAAVLIAAIGVISCGSAPSAFLVRGPGGSGNVPPTLTILQPSSNLTRGQGDGFIISWSDSDPDDNALISFDLINTTSDFVVPLVSGIPENDNLGPDSFTVNTTLIPPGAYNLRGTIDDSTNDPVVTFALTTATVPQRVIVQIVEAGQGVPTQPPSVAIASPLFDLSVTQDDTVFVQIVPSLFGDRPYDPDSTTTMWLVLDLDDNPLNDDPANADPNQIIVITQRTIAEGDANPLDINFQIDLTTVPQRPGGLPYFIRATIDDGTNPRVHHYAVGRLHITQLAAGLVDLANVGKSITGSRIYGFNPGANLGSRVQGITDFDADGVADFVLVAQFGNPRNVGPVGEAYLLYGLNQQRYGGTISANSTADNVPGVIFEAPPVRRFISTGLLATPPDAHTHGITDVNILPDYTGDGRPELIFGLPYVIGAFDTTDYDPGDDDIESIADEDVTVEVVVRQGQVTVQIGDADAITTTTAYTMQDTTISTTDPNANLGSSQSLSWENDGGGTAQWALIKFPNLLNQIPDNPFTIDITTVNATLELRTFFPGGSANVHQALTDFTESTTYDSFAFNGGDPEAGVDFRVEGGGGDGSLGDMDGGTPGISTVDITPMVQRLLDGLLEDFDNEIRLILIAQLAGGELESRVRSSEFTNGPDRPILRITYDRPSLVSPFGCYPDFLVNNFSNPPSAPTADVQFYGGGKAVVVNSTNRDNAGVINLDRLDSTSINLELVGQRGNFVLDRTGFDPTGNIFPRADNSLAGDNLGNDPDEPGRIAGARFYAGPFDFIDSEFLAQPPREGLFGQNVGFLGDVTFDGLGEIVISAPRNERYLLDLFNTFGFASTHLSSTPFFGSIIVFPGTNYNNPFWRDINDDTGTSTTPPLDQHRFTPFGTCSDPPAARGQAIPADTFQVFAEEVDDMLGGAGSSGDFNQDGLDDLLCGAPRNNRPGLPHTGTVYILYTRNVIGDFFLELADDPILRPPMLRIRGETPGDQLGWRQVAGRDVNGDRVDDIFMSSPYVDFGGIERTACGEDFNDDGTVNQTDFQLEDFNDCRANFGTDLFHGEPCKVFDFDGDNEITDDDRCVFCCLSNECAPGPDCIFGTDSNDCCGNLVNNGFAAVIFGGRFLDGDRNITQLATSDLPGVIFYGGTAGDLAGWDISSAGDFNQDGFGDILITAPGETRLDSAGRLRKGVVYLVFGGTHLTNRTFNLSDPERGVGSVELPGIVFLSPYVAGRPNEAAPLTVGLLGDINNDGFDDIAIGNPKADFIDLTFPQGPDAPGTDPAAGRRRDAGDVYIIYGSNFGSNRGAP